MSAASGTPAPLHQTPPYASSSVYSDSQQSGEKSSSSSEQPASRSTSLTDLEDISSKDASSEKRETVNHYQSKAAKATTTTNHASAANASNLHCSETAVLHRQSASTSASGSNIKYKDSVGARPRQVISHGSHGADRSRSIISSSRSISPEMSRSARLVAQSSNTRDRLPARAKGVHSPTGSSNSNKGSRPEGSILVRTRTPAPAIRHARRDMQFNLPCAARPDVSEEMNRSRLRISGGSIEKTSRTNARLRQLLGTVSNHKNLHWNQQTLCDLSSVLDLPAPTNQQEYETLRALIKTAQRAMGLYNLDNSHPSHDQADTRRSMVLGDVKNDYLEPKGKAGLANLKPNIAYFSHQSIPDMRTPNTGTNDKARRTPRLSYSYRGPLDLTFASREPCLEGLPPAGVPFVNSDETRTRSDVNRIGRFSDDFLLLETQLVPSRSISSARGSRRRRWSISESRPLAFSYKLASTKNAGDGGPSRTVAPIPTPSLASGPSMADHLPTRSSAGYAAPSRSPVYGGESSWRDSKLDLKSDGWSVRTPSVKSTATDYWNNIYSSNSMPAHLAHLARSSLYAEVAEQPTQENRTSDIIDWAQVARTPSRASESGHSEFSFAPSQAREWAGHARIEGQSGQRRRPPSEAQQSTSKAMQSPKLTGALRRLFTHRSFSRSDDTRRVVHSAQVDDETTPPSQHGREQIDVGPDIDDPEIELIPRELPNSHERPMSCVSSAYIDSMFQMAGGSLAPDQHFENSQKHRVPTRTSSIRSWWFGRLDRP